MDKATVELYDERAEEWRARRPGSRHERARRFGARVPTGALRVDLGCGPGTYLDDIGEPVVALDASTAMLRLAREASPGTPLVCADLEALPFADRSLDAAWASMSYLHVPSTRLPMALAHLHRALSAGAAVHIDLIERPPDKIYEGHDLPGDDFPGRFFSTWSRPHVDDVLLGAGFEITDVDHERSGVYLGCRSLATLPDTVAPDMRVLVCGLNPSLHAARRGIGYCGPGNRFWPAAVAAGLVPKVLDPVDALGAGVGMTDLVKRATATAAEVTRDELRAGIERVERLVSWLGAAVVCFVGLAGWRQAVDRRAVAGWQERDLAGARCYLMPSTSGLNAATRLDELVTHLREVTAAVPA